MAKWSGMISLFLGILILILSLIFGDTFWVALFYGIPLIIIGIIIILRKGEDNIEKIKYWEVKNNDKK